MDTKQLNKFKKDIKSIAGTNTENVEAILSLVTSAYEKGKKDGANQFAKLAGLMYEKS